MTVQPRTLAVALLLTAVGVSPAAGQWIDFDNQCSTGTIKTCASFQAQAVAYTFGGENRTQLYLRVRNLNAILADGSIGGSTLTRFGLLAPDLQDARSEDAVGGGAAVREEGNATQTGDAASMWGFNNSTNSLGDVEWAVGTTNAQGGIQDCIGPDAATSTFFRTCFNDQPDGWVRFSLTSRGTVDMSQLQLAWGVISVSSGGQGTGDLGSFQGATEVVPEPATLLLLGSGLLGVGAVGYARRRRERDEFEV